MFRCSDKLLSVDRKNIFISSVLLSLYGLSQVILAIFLLDASNLEVIIYAIGSTYFFSGIVGWMVSRGSGMTMIKCFKTLVILLIVFNFLLIIFCIIALVLVFTHFEGKCKKNSTFCEDKRTRDLIGTLAAFIIPIVIIGSSIVLLRIVYKFARQYEDDLIKYLTRLSQAERSPIVYQA